MTIISYSQVLHTSHSTLDRTCSDSVVSLRYRKSTSDLTNVTGNNSTPVVTAHHKRRGSSKVKYILLFSQISTFIFVKFTPKMAFLLNFPFCLKRFYSIFSYHSHHSN